MVCWCRRGLMQVVSPPSKHENELAIGSGIAIFFTKDRDTLIEQSATLTEQSHILSLNCNNKVNSLRAFKLKKNHAPRMSPISLSSSCIAVCFTPCMLHSMYASLQGASPNQSFQLIGTQRLLRIISLIK